MMVDIVVVTVGQSVANGYCRLERIELLVEIGVQFSNTNCGNSYHFQVPLHGMGSELMLDKLVKRESFGATDDWQTSAPDVLQ